LSPLDHSKLSRSTKSMEKTDSNFSASSQAVPSQSNLNNSNSPLTSAHLLQLQKTVGNQAVMQLMKSRMQSPVQLQEEPMKKKENTTGMPDQLKNGVESLSGMDMSDVRVNYNSDKPKHLNALAYAQGSDIHVGPGQEKHLPHEAWHVVQQKLDRVKPTIQTKGFAINDNDSLESEADVMGAKAMQMKTADPAKRSENHGANANANAPVTQLQDDYYPSGDKEPHIHMHPGGITYTGVGHSHKTLQSGDQIRENAITEVYQELQDLGTARALDIIEWIKDRFGIDPPVQVAEEEHDDENLSREWLDSEMEDHNPEGEPPVGFSYGAYNSKLK
jgi:hypothetical protein